MLMSHCLLKKDTIKFQERVQTSGITFTSLFLELDHNCCTLSIKIRSTYNLLYNNCTFKNIINAALLFSEIGIGMLQVGNI